MPQPVEVPSKPAHDLQDVADGLCSYIYNLEKEFLQEVLLDDEQRGKLIKGIDYHLNAEPNDVAISKLSSTIVETFSLDFIGVLKEVFMSVDDANTVSSLLADSVICDFTRSSLNPHNSL